MNKLNTAYVETHNRIWEHYFKLTDLKYKPVLIVGGEDLKIIANLLNILYYYRIDFINQNIKLDSNYTLSEREVTISKELINDQILYKMFYRFSFDRNISKDLYNKLANGLINIWFNLIDKLKLEALILHEMPHLPYTYIAFNIFKRLDKDIKFSASLPRKNKTYFVSSIENYGIFSNYSVPLYISSNENDNEKYSRKIIEDFGFEKKADNKNSETFLYQISVLMRNILLPGKTKRLNFFYFLNGKYRSLSDRKFYFESLKVMMKRAIRKRQYEKIAFKYEKSHNLKILFGLHFEPEMALYPLAGKYFDQFNIIKDLSNKIGNSGVIYVKEHPWIFKFSKIHGINRPVNFYKELASLNNIRFLSNEINTSSIIEQFDMVATLTGTIGWEAYLKKIPVLYYGFPWYSGLPGTIHISEFKDLESSILYCKEKFDVIDYEKLYNAINFHWKNVSVKFKNIIDDEYSEKATLLKQELEFNTFT